MSVRGAARLLSLPLLFCATAAQAEDEDVVIDAAPPPTPAVAPPAAPAPAPAPVIAPPPPPPPPRLTVSGYVQAQRVQSQTSVDGLSPDGDALNQDRYQIRRGRLALRHTRAHGEGLLELDANTVRGPSVTLKRAEVTAWVPAYREEVPPFFAATAGLSEIPFGAELRQSSRDRLFLERSAASRALFPSEYDVGLRLWGGLGPIRYAFAEQNGGLVSDDPSLDTRVLTAEKTHVGRLGLEVGRAERLHIRGGVSGLVGTGFHAGTVATKSSLTWNDLNQNGFVTLDELGAVNGQAATPSETFDRWAFGGDLSLSLQTPLGQTQLFGEAVLAANLDRALYVADPVATGFDLREKGWTAGITQEVGRYALFGFRADQYNGNADLTDPRRGQYIPTSAELLTLAPLIGVQLKGTGRLVAQYDYISDLLGRDILAEPADLPNDTLILRAQVEL